MPDSTLQTGITSRDNTLSSLPTALVPSPEVRSAGEEHLVLLDLATSQYFMLNGTGAWVWRRLEEGCSLDQAIDELADQQGASRKEIRGEVAELTDYLVRQGLLRPSHVTPGGGTRRRGDRRPGSSDAAPALSPKAKAPRRVRPPRWTTAWLALVYVDFVASAFGFRRLLTALPACPPQGATPSDPAFVAATVAAVDRATAFYFRKAWCLARSAACTWLLRRHRVPARLVLGVKPLPFYAHAWVEVGGHVVNDAEWVRRLDVLDRF